MPSLTPVTFFYPYPDDLAQLDAIALDDWRFWSAEWKERRRAWSLRTYLQLQQAGYDVSIADQPPDEGIVVIGPEMHMRRTFLQRASWRQHRHLLVVAVRADLPRCAFADAEILQNGKYHDGERFFHVPHWPQPGLIPRDPTRGTEVTTIAFKGYSKNLNPAFASTRWNAFLREHGLHLEGSTEQEKGQRGHIPWHDYAQADVVLAVRSDFEDPYVDKPASKLINAWRAGVPAVLSPEYPFRELRTSELDYIEVTSLDEVMDALLRLKTDPDLYMAMVEHGHERAKEFTPERITDVWGEVLFERVPRLAAQPAVSWSRPLPPASRRLVRLAQDPPPASELRFTWRWTRGVLTQELSKIRPWLGRMRRKFVRTLALDSGS